jgi:hypothetical protein
MKEIFESIDKWTLIKVLGGLTIVISSIISFIAYFIKDYFFNKWKSSYQKEIENLRAQSNANNVILNSLTSSFSNIYLSSNSKRIDSLMFVWERMIELKSLQPSLASLYSILVKDEIINIPNTTNNHIKACIEEFKPDEYLEKHYKITNEIRKLRPLIGENLWLTYFVYQAFLGRLIFLLQIGLEKGEVNYWQDDETFNQVLEIVIKPEELSKLIIDNVPSYDNVLNFLEIQAISDISEQISGKRMNEEAVSQALKLSKLSNNNSA